ncbi:MAG: Motility protein N-terminal domain containing protein [Firmicutes bacterium]|nr:Motility protein N-terminal domain containing protein [Bacillota bacterium]
MSRKRHSAEHHEEHADESWLIPYADILTLLLALFIVLFATSQVDQKKFEQMAQSLNVAFNGSPSMLEHMQQAPQSSQASEPPANQMPSPGARSWQQETTQLSEAKKMMDKYIEENNLSGGLETALLDEGLMIRIKDNALFPSGSAVLLPQSKEFAAQIAKLLIPLPQQVVVSGHTDNMPINTREFPTNWDLSSKRALNFMKFLLAQDSNLKPERFSSTGLGEYRPIVMNDSEEGRAKNRRVEVMVLRTTKQR